VVYGAVAVAVALARERDTDGMHKLLTFLVPASARVTVLTHATCSTRTTVARLASSTTPRRRFWIQVRIDSVRSIDEQYHP
jgi:hypothetical protein